MKIFDVLKVNFLVLSLLGVLYLMYKLNTVGIGEGLTTLMGVSSEPVGVRTATVGKIETLDWCDTRVKRLEPVGQEPIFQDKLKWYRSGTPPQELDFIVVEKWFGRNCRVRVQKIPVAQFDGARAGPALVVNFIKGEPSTLLKAPDGSFRWHEQTFLSTELSTALDELKHLPSAPGQQK